VKTLGRKKALEILYATHDIEDEGGMYTEVTGLKLNKNLIKIYFFRMVFESVHSEVLSYSWLKMTTQYFLFKKKKFLFNQKMKRKKERKKRD
jgi:hypothetical protein